MQWVRNGFSYTLSAKEIEKYLVSATSVKIEEVLLNVYRSFPQNINLQIEEFKGMIDKYNWKPSVDDQRMFSTNVYALFNSQVIRDWNLLIAKVNFASSFGNYDFSKLIYEIEKRMK